MLTAETKLPSVQRSGCPYTCTPDAQHVPLPPPGPHSSYSASRASSLQHPLHSSQPCCSSFASIQSLTPDTAVSSHCSQRAGVAHGSSLCDAEVDTVARRAGNADPDSSRCIRACYSDVQRHTVDGSLPLPDMCTREDNMYRQPSAASAILPTRQQQLAAICRLRKPLAVVTQKNSLIRYTGDGRRYWRWKDVVARVLHICRGASADDYSLLLQTEHWLEACDSKHRYGSNLKPYFKVWLESDTHQSFFKWLDEGQGLTVDIKDRPRSKLDADRVVYCGIERCFFEVTIVQGWFRYRISKRLVTTDSSRDQPPCPPNLGETMDSIRSQMLAPDRMHSPPLLGHNPARSSTALPPANPGVPLHVPPLLNSPQDRVGAQDCTAAQDQVDEHHGDAAKASMAYQSGVPDLCVEVCTDRAQAEAPCIDDTEWAQGPSENHPASMMHPTVRSGRLSVDGVSNSSASARRPGLLTQEFNRAAGMPYAQGGDSMRGPDVTRADLATADSLKSQGLPFSSSPASAPFASQQPLSPTGSQGFPQLPTSKSGSMLAGHDASSLQGKTCVDPHSNCLYPYHTDDRFAGGWLNDTGHLCMRRHGVNSVPSGLVRFPSLVSPSSRLFSSRDVGGSDDEDSSSLPYGRSVDESSVDASGGSSPASSSPRPTRSCAVSTPIRGKPTTTSASIPHASIHGFPSMPRLGVANTQPPLLRPPLRTLRFPSSSTTPEAMHSTAGARAVRLQPGASQRQCHRPVHRIFHSAEMPDVLSESGQDRTSIGEHVSDAASQGTIAPDVKQAEPSRHCKGWDLLRESLRTRKLRQPVSHSVSTAASTARKHAQRRVHVPLDSRVADVAHPRLVSNSAIPENLKLLDIVETVAAPGGSHLIARAASQVYDRDQGTVRGVGDDKELAAGKGGSMEVRDLADMLEERMVSTGQLVKVKTQAQLEQMLPCAPKVLSKDSCVSKKPSLQGRKCHAMVPVHEHGTYCNFDAMERPSEAMPTRCVQSECTSGPQEIAASPAPTARRDGEGQDAAEPPFQSEIAASAQHGQLAAAKDGTAVLEKTREKWIYVWDMHSRLYINRKMPGRFHHSSFVAGGAVKAAGSIVVEDGVLKQLTTWSGHYRPRASDIALFLQWLESNHVDMTNVELLLVKPNKPNSKMNKAA